MADAGLAELVDWFKAIAAGASRKPLDVIPLDEFIAAIRRVEAANPSLNALQIAEVVCRTRFTGAKFRVVLPNLQVSPVVAGSGVTEADVAMLRGAKGKKTVVRLDDGTTVDPIHVLMGLISQFDSGPATTLAGPWTPNGVRAAVTWAGDAGSAAACWILDLDLGGQGGNVPTLSDYITTKSDDNDLLGDVDGGAIVSSAFGFRLSDPLSDTILRYYRQLENAHGVRSRFHDFCDASGFTLDGGRLSDSARAELNGRIVALTWLSIASQVAEHDMAELKLPDAFNQDALLPWLWRGSKIGWWLLNLEVEQLLSDDNFVPERVSDTFTVVDHVIAFLNQGLLDEA